MFNTSCKPGNRVSNVVGDVQSVFNHFFDPSNESQTSFRPRWDIFETDESFLVTFELPGVKSEAVEVEVEGGILSVSGEKTIDSSGVNATCHRSDRDSGKFKRTLEFSTPVEIDNIEAVFGNGLLEIRVPKQEKDKPRKIKVNHE